MSVIPDRTSGGRTCGKKSVTVRFTRKISAAAFLVLFLMTMAAGCAGNGSAGGEEDLLDRLLLRDWMPESAYNIPQTEVATPMFPAIDLHAHDYVADRDEAEIRVGIMDDTGIERSVVLTQATGDRFDEIAEKYSEWPERFDLYCGLDLSAYPDANFAEVAIGAVNRCVESGGRGIGEIVDKGAGLVGGIDDPEMYLHSNDPRMDAVWEAIAGHGLPVNLHLADPIWMYLPMDSTNDGLTRSYTWRVEDQDRIVDHAGMMEIFAETLERNPNTVFVASHLANSTYDYSILAGLLDRYPNLYADISARFAEFSAIPRTTARFFEEYQDRLVYATDYGWETFNNNTDYGNNTSTEDMFRLTFRVLETEDEHFYMTDLMGYRWAMHGLGLSEEALRKIYRDNALRIMEGRALD